MNIRTKIPNFVIRFATEADVPLIFSFIQELAEYEKLSHEVVATETKLHETLFGARPYAEVILGEFEEKAVSFALFFHNYSTFLGQPGVYLEDVYVQPEMRGKGLGQTLLAYLAKLATERNCGRMEWAVLNWNEPAWKCYQAIGAVPMKEWTGQRLTGDALETMAEKF